MMCHKENEGCDNFLCETERFLKLSGYSDTDVLWCGNEDEYITWDDFKERANFQYDNGFGTHHIFLNFMIVGKDWWLERHEYDGSECWEFKKLPEKPEKYNKSLQFDDGEHNE